MSATILRARSDARVVPDERDELILAERVAARAKHEGPQVGDFLLFSDGVYHRFSYNHGERGLQVSGCHEGSYYLGKGYASYSGGLYPIVPREAIRPSDHTRKGLFWFFHHDYMTAGGGVTVEVDCRVFVTDLTSKNPYGDWES